MNSTYLLLKSSGEVTRASLDKIIARLCPKDALVSPYGDSLYKMSLPGGMKSLVLLQASFAAISADLYGGLTALIVPSQKDVFLPFLGLAEKGKISYLYEVGDKNPEVYEECQALLDDIDSETLFTIKTYIETERSPSLAALRLYVHRNTVAYRLSRFEEETGIAIDSYGNERFIHELIRRRKLSLEEGYI